MKNLYAFLFSLVSLISFSQIKLTSVPIELNDNSENLQMINFTEEKTNEIYTFIADKERILGIRFNSAVFFSDSLSSLKPVNFQHIVGYSFSKENNPVVHWITEDNKKIKSIEYDFSKNSKTFITNEITFFNESILISFTNKGVFYVITDNDKNELKLYEIDAQKNNSTTLETSDLNFTNSKKGNVKISQIFDDYPLIRMETDFYNPLMVTAEKVKFYLENNKAIFTFDLSVTKTEMLEIDLDSKTTFKREYQQPTLHLTTNQSNSFYLNQKLFQTQSNEKQLFLSIVDCNSNTVFKQYTLSENQNSFKDAIFLIQSEQYKPEEINSLKRFLRKIENSYLAFSIYPINNGYIACFGASKSSPTTGGIALGIGIGLGSIFAGSGFYDVTDFAPDRTQSVYFDMDLDLNFNIIPSTNPVLATTIISGFLEDKKSVDLYQTFKYRDYFVLGYYDKKLKELALYKFQNEY